MPIPTTMLRVHHAPSDVSPLDARLVSDWAELADRVEASPFSHPGWVMPWAAAHQVEIDLIAVRRNGALVAALPVVRTWDGMLTPTDPHTPLFDVLAVDTEALEDLTRILLDEHPRHLRLGFIDPRGAANCVVAARLRGSGYRVWQRTVLQSPSIPLAGSWDDLMAAWPSKRRSDLKRRRRRLEERGEVSFEVHDGCTDLDELLTEGFAVEASGWKGRDGTAIITEGTETMYRQAAQAAADAGSLRLAFLRLDGEAIAFDYSFQTAGVHYLVKTGFRPEYSAFAPGKLLRAFMIERAFAEGLRIYDFVGDADDWKLEWTDQIRPISVVDAYRSGPLGWVVQIIRFIDRAAAFAHRVVHRALRNTETDPVLVISD
jgi:CelD/BcsL family acetyltransferase involved in cellulose biosynthesis